MTRHVQIFKMCDGTAFDGHCNRIFVSLPVQFDEPDVVTMLSIDFAASIHPINAMDYVTSTNNLPSLNSPTLRLASMYHPGESLSFASFKYEESPYLSSYGYSLRTIYHLSMRFNHVISLGGMSKTKFLVCI